MKVKEGEKQVMEEQLYTVKEIASYLKVTDRAVKNWVKDGSLESYKIGRLIRISEEQLHRFIEQKNGER